MSQQKANLRTCASCEWIYKGRGNPCPKCGFASYGARYVYGNKAYGYLITQQPWFNNKVSDFESKLFSEIASDPQVAEAIRKKKQKKRVKWYFGRKCDEYLG